VAHPSGELCYLARGNISYVISGVTVPDPTNAQLLVMQPGDVVLITPPRSKTDQFGEIHCPFPSSVPFSRDEGSAGYIIRQIELDRPCHGASRDSTPLFADAIGRPFTHAVMDSLLHRMLTYLYDAKVASCYSWHSLRIGLATALKAANCDDNIIQMICRWTNPDSLRAYARHGQSLHINCVDQAEKAIIDAIQSSSVPKVCNSEGNIAIHLAFGGPISKRAQAVLDAADEAEMQTGIEEAVIADTSPIDAHECMGRRVIIPRDTWPRETCTENAGRGWTARILACARGVATLRFEHCTTARGIPYQEVKLQVDRLEPI